MEVTYNGRASVHHNKETKTSMAKQFCFSTASKIGTTACKEAFSEINKSFLQRLGRHSFTSPKFHYPDKEIDTQILFIFAKQVDLQRQKFLTIHAITCLQLWLNLCEQILLIAIRPKPSPGFFLRAKHCLNIHWGAIRVIRTINVDWIILQNCTVLTGSNLWKEDEEVKFIAIIKCVFLWLARFEYHTDLYATLPKHEKYRIWIWSIAIKVLFYHVEAVTQQIRFM